MATDNSKSTVYVDVEDDIATIIEKVEEAEKSVVALVLPKRSQTLQSTVNLRLLKSAAGKSSKKLALVTSDAALLPLAGAVGLPVAKNLESAPEIPDEPTEALAAQTSSAEPEGQQPYATSRIQPKPEAKSSGQKAEKALRSEASVGALADAHERKEPETVELGDEEEPAADNQPQSGKEKLGAAAAAGLSKLPKVKVPNFDRFRRWAFLGGGGLIALIIFLYLALAVLPKAVISISTTSTPVSLNMNLNASGGAKKLDETNSIIPSSVQKYNQTAKKTITATGQQNVGSKATTDITITTSDCSNSESLPAGSEIDSGNLAFFTQTSLTFGPTGGVSCNYKGDTTIVAQSAGTSYNGLSSFTVNGHSDLSVSANSPSSGGSSKIVTVVSQQDLNQALTAISNDNTQPSQSDVTKQFQSNLDSQGYYIIASTLKVAKPTASSSPAVGQQATSATVTITTTYSALVVKKSDLTKFITDYANKQIDTSKQKIDLTDILNKVTVDVVTQTSPTDASLSIGGSVNAVPIIDASTVKTSSAGKKKGDIQALISNWPGVKSVNVHLSPFWVSKVPAKQSRIIVNISAVSGN